MYKIVVTTPAGDFTFDKVYSSVSEANEYIETLYKHFDETASFKVVLTDLSEIKYKLIKVSKNNEMESSQCVSDYNVLMQYLSILAELYPRHVSNNQFYIVPYAHTISDRHLVKMCKLKQKGVKLNFKNIKECPGGNVKIYIQRSIYGEEENYLVFKKSEVDELKLLFENDLCLQM